MKLRDTRCPDCGESRFRVKEEDDRFVYGIGEQAVTLCTKIPVHTCQGCGYEFTNGGAEDARHDAICRHLGRIPPKKILELRKANNLSQVEFAALSGFGTASLSRWESGQLIQSAANDNLLYLLLEKSNIHRLAARKPEPDYVIQDDYSCEIVSGESSFIYLNSPTAEIRQRMEHFSLHRH